jgi:hypothetical protein
MTGSNSRMAQYSLKRLFASVSFACAAAAMLVILNRIAYRPGAVATLGSWARHEAPIAFAFLIGSSACSGAAVGILLNRSRIGWVVALLVFVILPFWFW